MLYDNTTVTGTWIDIQDMTELSSKYGQRIINNITMAMPHSAVFTAARDPLNQIMQPETLDVRTTFTSFKTGLLMDTSVGSWGIPHHCICSLAFSQCSLCHYDQGRSEAHGLHGMA